MADNVTYQSAAPATPAAGDVIAAQDVGGVKYQEVIVHGLTGDETYKGLRIDATTHSVQTISYEHHEIHSGSSFTVFNQDDSVASAAGLSFSFKTPNTAKLIHLIVECMSSGESITTLLETASSTADGDGEVAVVPVNRQRDSGGATTLLEDTTTGSFDTVGVTKYPESVGIGDHPTGTTIDVISAGSGNKGGGAARGYEEFVLARNTVYGIVMLSKAAANAMILKLDWYEHTQRTA